MWEEECAEYLTFFLTAAALAALPTSVELVDKYDMAKVSTTDCVPCQAATSLPIIIIIIIYYYYYYYYCCCSDIDIYKAPQNQAQAETGAPYNK